jgi:hypothetical protein
MSLPQVSHGASLGCPNFFRLEATRLALSEAKTRSGIDDKSHSGEYCIAVALLQLGIGVSAIIEPDVVTSVCVAAKERRSILF